VKRSDSSIRRLRFWNYSAGPGENHNAYFNDLLLTEEAAGGTLQDSVMVYLVDPENNIPDWWMIQHFGSVTGSTARADRDGDGHTNREEFWLGTIPTNDRSRLVIQSIDVNGAGVPAITWLSVGGRSYDVQHADSLSATSLFSTVVTVLESDVPDGVATNRTFQDTVSPPPVRPVRAYRVQLRR